ncbi:hypothetical protein DFQ28_008804 [Apophysomyces sp. BC1034]|nr:hypothetical protein DFQ30_009246 [Apophysomyces sp. BC1015]KAG0174492.1 hypothetical protein DFQ29_007457 [Apophysomyces sp. BC1021]KAG0185771.1 hypothetical protein DFQ28_008804 [Apophysomyces sp. BC1034]
MTDVPLSLWFASSLAVTASISALVLSVQRGYYHKSKQSTAESGPDPGPLKFDEQRDLSVPFADDTRLTRITFGTLVLTALSAYSLYVGVHVLSDNHSQDNIHSVIAAALIFASWLYAFALTLTSRRYRFPSDWGWVLNVHLCLFYFVALCDSVQKLGVTLWQYDNLTLAEGLPLFLSVLLAIDLVYTTGTIERGPPFLDEHGKRVVAVTVSSIWGFLYFTWVSPLIKVAGRKTQLEEDDLPVLPPIYRGHNLFYIFGRHRSKSLMKRLFIANGKAFTIQIVTAVTSALLYYAPAFFMNRLLILIQDITKGQGDSNSMSWGFLLVLGLSGTLIVIGILTGQLWYWAASSLQVRVKAMLNVEIYRKTLRRRDTSSTNAEDDKADEADKDTKEEEGKDEKKEDVSSSTGTIVNLMSTDSNRISEFSTWWFVLLEAPVELAAGIYFLYHLLGLSSFLGLLVLVITLPVNHYNAQLFAKTQDQLMESRDKRVSLMNEVLQGIRQIKFFAWETNWEKRVMEARNVELKHLRTTYICEVLFSLLWQGSPLLVTVLSFWSFTTLEGKQLTAPIAFTSIAVFDELRFALNVLPEAFIEMLQCFISVRRIETYLGEEEIEPPVSEDANSEVNISFTDATVGWMSASAAESKPVSVSSEISEATRLDSNDGFVLKDVTAQFPNGEMSLICGATGSGKTLLMLSLLGEAVVVKGKLSCPRAPIVESVSSDFSTSADIPPEEWILDRAVAYVSQTAWLQNASIRDNILFGLPYVEKRYKDTVYACALDKDLSYLEDGDETEIGEKGITLSGGQKARVALARAVYSRAKNVLMDDVLSAVDAHTAKHLYEKCLMGPLMRSRTRILITHHVGLCVKGSAYLLHIQGGIVNLSGSPSELRQSGALATILEEVKEHAAADEAEEIADNAEVDSALPLSEGAEEVIKKKPKALVEEETRATGKVKSRLYTLYMSTVGNLLFWAVIVVFVIGSRGLDVSSNWWLKRWAQSYEKQDANATFSLLQLAGLTKGLTSKPASLSLSSQSIIAPTMVGTTDIQALDAAADDRLSLYLGIYVAINVLNIFIGSARFAMLYWGTLGASRKLYAELLHRVFRAPLRFYDITPVGRILNRFSKDFETIDSTIPNDILNFAIQMVVVISSIATVSIVLPVFTVPIIVVAIVNVIFGSMFVNASRELKRLDSVTRSPLFTHFSETIVGVTTIRAFGATQQFMQEMLKRIDANARPYFFTWIVNRWVSVRFAVMGAAVNFIAASVILLSLDFIDAATAGFCLSFLLNYTDTMFWAIRRYTSLEMNFNAIERVVEFMEMDQEAPAFTDKRPPALWPSEGEIHVEDLEVRYAADLDPVLKGLTFSINAREKIGVVGRTGSGKSTLALSFFRFVEASRGKIVIDNIDIKDIGTEDLRSNLTIIPQDPTLFSGTLRTNMDPFDQFSDDDIFTALRRVHLLPSAEDEFDSAEIEDVNTNVFKNLSTPVSEGGKNFSQGQRQLLCLARALLKRSRVVLMDEATASVDFQTDKAIQKTISTEFVDCTILCIAHRLHTVIEYDRILVLDHGEVKEFASPLDLINDADSVFYKMCQNSGDFETLVALAKSKHQLVEVE